MGRKPYGTFVKPVEATVDGQILANAKTRSGDLGGGIKEVFVDNLTECMKTYAGHKGIVQINWSAPYLYAGNNHLWITHYFPSVKTAVDKFKTLAEYQNGHTEIKEKLCNENGVFYVALCPGDDLPKKLATAKLQEVK